MGDKAGTLTREDVRIPWRLRDKRRALMLLYVIAREGFGGSYNVRGPNASRNALRSLGEKIGGIGLTTMQGLVYFLYHHGYLDAETNGVTPKGHKLLQRSAPYVSLVCDVLSGEHKRVPLTDGQIRDLEVRLLTRIPNNEVSSFLSDYDEGLCVCDTLDAVARRKAMLEAIDYRKTAEHWPACPKTKEIDRGLLTDR